MAMNAVVDERTLREIYLTGFEIAIKEGGAKTVMSSYNEVNGVYANENEHLLKDILRDEWGFRGMVLTIMKYLKRRKLAAAASAPADAPVKA